MTGKEAAALMAKDQISISEVNVLAMEQGEPFATDFWTELGELIPSGEFGTKEVFRRIGDRFIADGGIMVSLLRKMSADKESRSKTKTQTGPGEPIDPLARESMKKLLTSDGKLSDEEVEALFRKVETETSPEAREALKAAIHKAHLNKKG